jgi:hypothetical protein
METITSTDVSQAQKIMNYLRGTGRELTSAQAQAMWNIRNLRARMSELRKLGLRVNTRTNYNGLTAYSISARDKNGSRSKITFEKS